MSIKQSRKAVVIRALKIGASLIVVSIIYGCAVIWLLPLDRLISLQMWNKGTLIFTVLLLIPSLLLDLGVSKDFFPKTILGWFLGVMFLLLIFFIFCLILSVLIELIKGAFSKAHRKDRS
jgi:hypothetical protein